MWTLKQSKLFAFLNKWDEINEARNGGLSSSDARGNVQKIFSSTDQPKLDDTSIFFVSGRFASAAIQFKRDLSNRFAFECFLKKKIPS